MIAPPPSRPILYTVCAWCTPRAVLDLLNVRFPGQISHSVCPLCVIAIEQAVA